MTVVHKNEPDKPISSADIPRFTEGLKLLLRAYRYSTNVQSDIWEFGVEVAKLKEAGLDDLDLRLLVRKGYVDHRSSKSRNRRSRGTRNLKFTDHVRFALTKAGAKFATAVTERIVPAWDAVQRELRVGQITVKSYKTQAANQILILTAFQEEGWPDRIDDPLLPEAGLDPKQRLHATINSLNRNMKQPLIAFRGDGTGTGVLWGLLQ